MSMFNNILVVCVGNICRSATAEVLLKVRLAEAGKPLQVHSAGLGALVGHDIEPTARQVLAEHGIEAGPHSARQIDDAMLSEADLILVMEKRHRDAIAERAPHASGKTMLLGKWQEDREIPDPYRQQKPAFDHAYKLIDDSVNAWLNYL